MSYWGCLRTFLFFDWLEFNRFRFVIKIFACAYNDHCCWFGGRHTDSDWLVIIQDPVNFKAFYTVSFQLIVQPLFDVSLKLFKVHQRLLSFCVNKPLNCFFGFVVASVMLILIVLPEVHGFTPSFNCSLLQFLTPLFYFIDFINFKACILLYVAVYLFQSVKSEIFLLLKLLHLLSKTVRLTLVLFLVFHLCSLAVIRI